MSGQETKKERDKGRSTIEWITLIISISLVLALFSLIVYEYLGQSDQPPQIVVSYQRQQVKKLNGSFVLPVVITNHGEQTATNVLVIISFGSGGNQADQTQIQIDFLAGGATEQRMVVTQEDPSRVDLRVNSISFAVP